MDAYDPDPEIQGPPGKDNQILAAREAEIMPAGDEADEIMVSIHDKNGWLIGGDEVSVKVIWNRIKDEGPDWLKEFWPTAEGPFVLK